MSTTIDNSSTILPILREFQRADIRFANVQDMTMAIVHIILLHLGFSLFDAANETVLESLPENWYNKPNMVTLRYMLSEKGIDRFVILRFQRTQSGQGLDCTVRSSDKQNDTISRTNAETVHLTLMPAHSTPISSSNQITDQYAQSDSALDAFQSIFDWFRQSPLILFHPQSVEQPAAISATPPTTTPSSSAAAIKLNSHPSQPVVDAMTPAPVETDSDIVRRPHISNPCQGPRVLTASFTPHGGQPQKPTSMSQTTAPSVRSHHDDHPARQTATNIESQRPYEAAIAERPHTMVSFVHPHGEDQQGGDENNRGAHSTPSLRPNPPGLDFDPATTNPRGGLSPAITDAGFRDPRGSASHNPRINGDPFDGGSLMGPDQLRGHFNPPPSGTAPFNPMQPPGFEGMRPGFQPRFDPYGPMPGLGEPNNDHLRMPGPNGPSPFPPNRRQNNNNRFGPGNNNTHRGPFDGF